MASLQYFNISYNNLQDLSIKKCSSSKKSLITIDLSDNGQQIKQILDNSSIFNCAQFENIHLRNNTIYLISEGWQIFHKSLRTLDLRRNEITDLAVSTIYFSLQNYLFFQI